MTAPTRASCSSHISSVGQQRRVSGNLLEQRIALVERAHGALEGIKIGWPQLRKLHIHKTPSFRRAFLDDLQIFRRKQHAADMAQQFADAFRLPKPDAHGFFFFWVRLRITATSCVPSR